MERVENTSSQTGNYHDISATKESLKIFLNLK